MIFSHDTITPDPADGFELLRRICTLTTGTRDLVQLRTNMERLLTSLSLFDIKARLKMLHLLYPYTLINTNTGNYHYQKLISFIELAFRVELHDTHNSIYSVPQLLFTQMKTKVETDEFTMIDYDRFKNEMDRSIQQTSTKLFPISKATTSTNEKTTTNNIKKSDEHPFCWMCAYYGRNLNIPHIAKFCKENSTNYKGTITIPGQKIKIPDYSATKTTIHPDYGQDPDTIIKSEIMKDPVTRRKITSASKVKGKGEWNI